MPSALETPDRRTGLKNLKSGRGRRWGSKNRLPLDLKRSIISAAESFGSDGRGAGGLCGYLFMLADRDPRSFAMLLQKLLPLQLDADVTSNVVDMVRVVSVPAGDWLSAEDLRRMLPQLEIEAEVEPKNPA
ncbi:hypothetical protein AAFX91_27980 [Bradyrhizobium sp. 31Argb]|uniref:hypothetical protein n=1 Tax=Bradyrhizobium sp. 31Argb TaxID=3141247 RepID=UPI0037493EF5